MPRVPSIIVCASAAWIAGAWTAIWALGWERQEAHSKEAWNAMLARDEAWNGRRQRL